jgi:DnaJ-class molecular chaperone
MLTKQSPFTYWHSGPFLHPMTRREAGQILGISSYASIAQVKEAHRRVMLLNHPDRGGSPFIALKINEAKEMLSK